MKFRSIIPFTALVAAATVVGFTTGQGAASPEVGAPAPTFTAVDSNGKAVDLNSFKGKFVVLEWFNHQCPFVVKHYAPDSMQQTQRDLTQKGVVWLTIISSAEGKQGYLDAAAANDRKAQWKMASTAIVLDPSGAVGRLYGARTTPHMFLIDPKGTLVYKGAIDDKPSADSADIASSKNLIRQAYAEASTGRAVSQSASTPYGCSVKY